LRVPYCKTFNPGQKLKKYTGRISQFIQGENFSGGFSSETPEHHGQFCTKRITNNSILLALKATKLNTKIASNTAGNISDYKCTVKRHFPTLISANITLTIRTHGGAAVCDETAELKLSVGTFGMNPAPCYYHVDWIAGVFSDLDFNNVLLLALSPSENINQNPITCFEKAYLAFLRYVGRAMAQAVSRRPVTAKARVRSRVKSMWGLWWTKWQWNRFFSELSVFPCQFHSTGASVLVKLGKKTAHLHHHRVAQKALRLWCVRSICCGALHHVKEKDT
jgi:hypothetical protein